MLDAILKLGILNQLYLHAGDRTSVFFHRSKDIVQLLGLIHLAVQILHFTCLGILLEQALLLQIIVHQIKHRQDIIRCQFTAILCRNSIIDLFHQFAFFRL